MKRYEKKRLAWDRKIDSALQTARGRREYWNQLMNRCRRESLISLLESTLHLPGDVIECGVYRGYSLMRLARVLSEYSPEKTLYACDSFSGFPEEKVGRVDLGRFRFLRRVRKKFKMCADTPQRLERICELFGIQGEIVRGYFSDTLPRFRNTPWSFIHLDCDLYQSYKECLHLLYENLVPGGVIVLDDYRAPKWPGAEKAVDEFFSALPESVECCTARATATWYVRKLAPAHSLSCPPAVAEPTCSRLAATGRGRLPSRRSLRSLDSPVRELANIAQALPAAL